MKEKQNSKSNWPLEWFVLFLIVIFFVKCDDKTEDVAVWDPTRPVEFTTFYPDSGGVNTPMFIRGENFGSDTSLIRVWINEHPAKIISSNGSCIYCFVPSRSDTGYVKVRVGDESNFTEHTFDAKFKYKYNFNVSTLCGFTDKDGNSSLIDGSFDKAQFEEPYWLTYDNEGNLYLLEERLAMRKIDFQNNTVTTLCKIGRGWDRPRTMSFNPTFDTLYVTNDQGNWDGIGCVVFTKETAFTDWKTLIKSKQCNGGDVQPQTGDFFYNSFEKSQFYKWNRATKQAELIGLVGDNEWEYNVQFAPSGDFAYLVSVRQCYIMKSKFNRQTNCLEMPTVFAGGRDQSGYADGVGTAARFREPHQGTFDENDNFYLCDRMNHCIRKITPEGVVTTFAGRPEKYGYADGPLRQAQFDRPHGIVYNREKGVFYVADQKNRRIRAISVE